MQGFGTTPVSSASKLQPSRTSGTATGFFSAQCPLSATQARTQFTLVHKKWRRESYSVVGTVFFVGLNKAGSSEWLQYRVIITIIVITVHVQREPRDTENPVVRWTIASGQRISLFPLAERVTFCFRLSSTAHQSRPPVVYDEEEEPRKFSVQHPFLRKVGETRIQAQTKAEFTKKIQRLGALCESRTKELTMLKLQLRHASAGFASFAVVVQHLNAQVLQNNSFHVPKLSEELRKSQEVIEKAGIAIEVYKNKIEELKQSHEKKINSLRKELEASHKKRTKELEEAHQNELTGYLEAHTRKLEKMKAFYADALDNSRKNSNETLDAMKQRQRENIDVINEEYSLELDSINEDHQARQKELQQRYEALQQQYKQLHQQAREFQESVLSDTDAKIQWLSKKMRIYRRKWKA
ncbi:hypothetical protein MRX96_034659 [Rhipicephalus microplus]